MIKDYTGALSSLAFFRFRRLEDEYLLTNEVGDFIRLTPDEFRAMRAGTLAQEYGETYDALGLKGFIRSRLSKEDMSRRYAGKYFVGGGTSLHIIVLTLRCDQACVYCHASTVHGAGHEDLDMTMETGMKVVEKVFTSCASSLHIEFQGGEALLNFPVLKAIVVRAREIEKTDKRPLRIAVVTNLALMTEAIARFFLQYNVSVCSSLDGPPSLHDWQRRRTDGVSSHGLVTYWLKRLQAMGASEGKFQRPQALVTITKKSFPFYKEIIDEYQSIGAGGVFLRFINPLGAAEKSLRHLGYTAQEYVDFYRKALDYIIEINNKGTLFYEQTAVILLSKILTGSDPNFLDIRSPCGAGIGQITYNYNGAVYTCDEARMLAALGDESFRVAASVDQFSFDRLTESPVVKSCCAASCQDVVPGCSECAYKPYCGTCPVINYKLEGHIDRKSAYLCGIRLGVFDIIFKHLKNPESRDIFYTWIKNGQHLSAEESVHGTKKEE